MDKKKILICSNIYPPEFIGGAELIAHKQAKEMMAQGHDVLVFAGQAMLNKKEYSIIKDSYEGIPIYRIQLTYERFNVDKTNFIQPSLDDVFLKVLSEFNPDVVHCHNIAGLSIRIIYLAKKMGCTTVVTIHDNWGFCFKNTTININNTVCEDYNSCYRCMRYIYGEHKHIPIRIRRDYIKYLLNYADALISPSQYLADTYSRAGFDRNRIQVLWNGIEVEKFNKVIKKASVPIRFTFIGHIGWHKGIHLLLEACHLLKDKYPIQINIVGKGEELENYKEQVRNLDIKDNVIFWGKINNSDIIKAYEDTDVLILPSVWPENQPVSITEAMAAHIPVIATNKGGSTELVQVGHTGYLFKLGEAQDLAFYMEKYLKEPFLIAEHGNNAYELIKRYTVTNQVSKLINLYDCLKINPNSIKKNGIWVVVIEADSFDENLMNEFNRFENYNVLFALKEWLDDDESLNAREYCIIDSDKINDIVIKRMNQKKSVLIYDCNTVLLPLGIKGGSCHIVRKNRLFNQLSYCKEDTIQYNTIQYNTIQYNYKLR